MKKLVVLFFLILFSVKPAFAQGNTSAPHLVINFAMMNDLDWAAPESQWQHEMKPKIEDQIKTMRSTLCSNVQCPMPNAPILSWSTLMEYMNFPMDTPSADSVYAVKMRRILEVAEDLDFPVFVPLNGYQWWDQLPELYNWWDSDGTHTDPKFFARQKNPEEFKTRFIAGFDPDNQANVEWQSPRTPMKLGYRNWGGGGFRLAPPPNLLSDKFQNVQRARLKVILAEINKKKIQWEMVGKRDLFVGLSIGTEISLNASVTPADEFKPYGFNSIRTLKERMSSVQMTNDQLRSEALRQYLESTSQYVNRSGLEKEKIFTHVYGETDPVDSHYAPYADAAFNLYSLPGSSFYGHKDDPLASAQWNAMLTKYGHPQWGAIEYSDTPTASGLQRTLAHARIIDIYNWDSLQNNQAAKNTIKQVLASEVQIPNAKCQNPIVHVQLGTTARLGNPEMDRENLKHGIYVKFEEMNCGADTVRYSAPQIFYVPLPEVPDTTPAWVKWLLTTRVMLGR